MSTFYARILWDNYRAVFIQISLLRQVMFNFNNFRALIVLWINCWKMRIPKEIITQAENLLLRECFVQDYENLSWLRNDTTMLKRGTHSRGDCDIKGNVWFTQFDLFRHSNILQMKLLSFLVLFVNFFNEIFVSFLCFVNKFLLNNKTVLRD